MRRCTLFWVVAVVLSACASSRPSGNGDIDASTGAIDAANAPDAIPVDAGPPDAIPCIPDPDGETCNGNDDDCDGTTDEGFPGVGNPCEVGVGECVNSGVTVCTADGTGTECGAQPLTPGQELCGTGLDEDCDSSTDEGFPDLNTGCTVGTGACFATGVKVCSASGLSTQCNAQPGDSNPETCNNIDDDCDGLTDEDFQINQACDGAADSDLCTEGVWACNGTGGRVCTDNTASTFDLCGNGDEDCDPTSGDGSEDGAVGQGCDGTDGDLCVEGVRLCSGGNLVCTDNSGTTLDLCGGGDEDCDAASTDGSEDPAVGVSCDGGDSDLCTEGVRQCNGGSLTCSDSTGSTVDLCGNGDEDCDPGSTDGSEDPQVGQLCDGSDTDKCNEGVRQCSGGSLSCTDTTGSTVDICNNADDDCDAASADGAEDPQTGQACDGGDSDLCNEGTKSCVNGGFSCSDATGSTVDLCNNADDDCDPASTDGSEDPGLNTACDGSDGDSCVEGTMYCGSGSLACSDTTSTTTELCNQVDDDCNGTVDDGWNRNNNPACSTTNRFTDMSGDTNNDQRNASGWNEQWYVVKLVENNLSDIYLSATVTLTSAPGTDFDLYVYCISCGGSLAGSSTSTGATDIVNVRAEDDSFEWDDRDILIEVRHWSSSVCAPWSLNVSGNTTVSNTTCDF